MTNCYHLAPVTCLRSTDLQNIFFSKQEINFLKRIRGISKDTKNRYRSKSKISMVAARFYSFLTTLGFFGKKNVL